MKQKMSKEWWPRAGRAAVSARTRLGSAVSGWWMRLGCAALALAGPRALAQLPDVATPDGIDEDSGDYIGVFQAYALQIVVLGGLLVAVAALFIVAKNMLSKYSEIATGRATWGELGMHAAAGVVLLVIVIFLMTQATGVLEE